MMGASVHMKNMLIDSSVITRFEILLWFYGPEKFPGLSRNGPLVTYLSQHTQIELCMRVTWTKTRSILIKYNVKFNLL